MRQSRFFQNNTPRHVIVALAGFTLAAAPSLFAQVDTGKVTGTVTDQSGAVVSGAQVTARNLGTNQSRSIKAAGNGTYDFEGLQAAQYEISVAASGFETYTQQVEVTVGGHPTVDVKLNVGQGTEKVTVSAGEGGVEVNTSSQELSQIIGTEQVAQLPSLTRNPYDFVGISGNVSNGDAAQGHSQNSIQQGIGYTINGQRSAGTDILLDGVENNDVFDTGVGQTVPLDTVQEYRILTSNFAAQFGRASGGVVNVITKAGTNALHGGAWEFNRLSAYTANTYDNDANGVAKGNYTRNQFGFDLGGPIKKDKLFFYEGTEWLRVRSSANQISLVPDPAFIAASSANTQAYFKAYGQNQPAANDGVITAGQLATLYSAAPTSPLGMLSAGTPVFDQVAFAAPTDAGGGPPTNQIYLNSRVDYNFTAATQTYVRYAYWKFTNTNGYDFSSPYAQYNVGDGATDNSVLWNISHIFSPKLLTNTKLSFTRFNAIDTYNTALQNTPTLFLSNGATVSGVGNGHQVQLPGFYSQDIGAGGLPYGGPQNTIQWNQDLNWSKGAHEFQFGLQLIYIQSNRSYGAYAQADEELGTTPASGLNNFISGTTSLFEAAVNPKGALPCDENYLTGALTQTPGCTITLPATAPSFARSDRFHDTAGYAQDQWKAIPRVTLDYGVRYEYYGVQHNNNPNLDSNFYYGAGPGILNEVRNGQVFTVPNSPIHSLWKPSYGTVAPRVGFALDLFGDGKSSLRGGYGISYERNFGNVTFNVIQNPPNYAVIEVQGSPVSTSNAGPLGGSSGSQALPPTSLRNVDQNIRTAATQFYSLALDQQLAPNTVISFQYAGARGTHLYDIKNYNELGAGNVYLGDPFDPTETLNASGYPQQTFHYSRPNNEYSSINNRGSNGDSYYNALNVQFQATNFLHSGVSLVANYTWSHSIDDNSDTFGDSNSAADGVGNLGYTNPLDPGLDKGASDFDIRNRFTAAPIWDTPWFKQQHNLKGELLGNYHLSSIYTVRSGTPFTYVDSTNSLNAAYQQGIVRYTPAPGGGPIRFHSGSSMGTFGPNDFLLNTLPLAEPFGNPAFGPSPNNSGTLNTLQAAAIGISDFGPYPANMTQRNAFTGPGAWSFDLAASKSFPIKEGITGEFRAEGFDILNHHNLYALETTTDVAESGYAVAPEVTGKKGGVNGGANDERRFGQFALKINF